MTTIGICDRAFPAFVIRDNYFSAVFKGGCYLYGIWGS